MSRMSRILPDIYPTQLCFDYGYSRFARKSPWPWLSLEFQGENNSTNIVNTGYYPSATIVKSGDVKISTDQKKTGLSSLGLNLSRNTQFGTNFLKITTENYWLWNEFTLLFSIYFVPFLSGYANWIFSSKNAGIIPISNEHNNYIGKDYLNHTYTGPIEIDIIPPASYQENVWYDIKLYKSGNSFKWYRNNVFVGQSTNVSTIPTAATVDTYLGYAKNDGGPYQHYSPPSYIDDFKIYTHAA